VGGNGLRALKVLTVVMGVLILVGTGVLVAVIIHRGTSTASSVNIALQLDEPAGTHIAGIAATQDRLAIALQGGGGDRVVLIEPRTGAIAGRISLAH
jgi:hypothetical protein